MVTRGFTGRQQAPDIAKRLPPGQSLTADPVLSAGPTPQISLSDWSFTLKVGPKPVAKWNWAEFNALPKTHQIPRHPLRHQMVEARHALGRRAGRRRVQSRRHRGTAPSSSWRTPSTAIPPTCRSPRPHLRQGDDRAPLRRQPLPPDHGAGAALRAASLFLEVGEMGEWAPIHRTRRGRLLGAPRLSHLRRSLARAALHR